MRGPAIWMALLAAACAPESAPPAQSPPPGIELTDVFSPAEVVAPAAFRNVEFGDVPLGTQMREYPETWRRLRRPCDWAMIAPGRGYCPYVHEDIVYSFDQGVLLAKEIHLRFPPEEAPVWPQGRALPYGLRGDETPDEAARTIEAHTGVAMEVHHVATHARLWPRDPIAMADGRTLSIHIAYQYSEAMVSILVALIHPLPPTRQEHLDEQNR